MEDVILAKHSKKKIFFNFSDFQLAEEFLQLVERKKMYTNVTAKMNPTGKLELTLVGSPENIKKTDVWMGWRRSGSQLKIEKIKILGNLNQHISLLIL